MNYNYFSLFTIQELALLHDWLLEAGELYVDIYHIHSGGGSISYRIRSLNELKALTSEQTWPEIAITIFRKIQYELRGIADDKLLEQAIKQIPDGQWYTIISLDDFYPSISYSRGNGNTHVELERDILELEGERVGIGQNPFDIHDEVWFRSQNNEIFMLSVKRNQYKYENYEKQPQRYNSLGSLLTDKS